jgi:hypothetical protein
VDDSRHRLRSITDDESDESDVGQPDNVPLETSSLFWSNQLVLSLGEDDQVGLGKPVSLRTGRIFRENLPAPSYQGRLSRIIRQCGPHIIIM